MKRIIFCFLIVSFVSLFSFQVFGQENARINIFSEGRPIEISAVECTSPSPIHSVRIDREKWKIYWRWDNKSFSSCRWRTEITPEVSLAEYQEGYLIIKFIGDYMNRPPQVELIYSGEKHTNPINFNRHFKGMPEFGVTVKIPLKKFVWDSDVSMDYIKINAIQFDADYNSIFGKITITYIGLSKNEEDNIGRGAT